MYLIWDPYKNDRCLLLQTPRQKFYIGETEESIRRVVDESLYSRKIKILCKMKQAWHMCLQH